ncbi:MAG: hypothetical protein ABR579_03110 [Actinomycetota bacterium]
MTSSSIPDSPTPILGYRVWGLDGMGLLHSASSGFTTEQPLWRAFEPFAADCLALSPCKDEVPALDHGCGIHAYTELEPALKWARAMRWERAIVVGRVKLWGRVVQSQKGWRAEKAYPEHFITVITRSRRASVDIACLGELAQTYGTSSVSEGSVFSA